MHVCLCDVCTLCVGMCEWGFSVCGLVCVFRWAQMLCVCVCGWCVRVYCVCVCLSLHADLLVRACVYVG